MARMNLPRKTLALSRFWIFLVFLYCQVSEAALPCGEIHRDLAVPCRCDVRPTTLLDQGIGVLMDCDHVVFPSDLPQLPRLAPIIGYSQRYVGHQSLHGPIFEREGLPLQKLDLSHNNLRRLPPKVFSKVSEHLEELYITDNLLGDNLNPIFSSPEFRGLANLQILDLTGNYIRGLEEGILRGCDNLQELRLDRNMLSAIPTSSLYGPHTLRTLSIADNRISTVKKGALTAQPAIERLRLDRNGMSALEGNAFAGLSKLRELTLSANAFTRFNSDVFLGIENVEKLDLSHNILNEIPEEALKLLPHLKNLNLSSNQIDSIGHSLASFQYLESLDLSRNKIANIHPGAFLSLKRLRRLELSVNSLRTIEDDAFEGLENLEVLSLEDNNILLIPSSALGRMPKLSILNLAYNRISAISPDILRTLSARLVSLSLSRNVIRELQSGTFQDLAALKVLDLSGNLISSIEADTFAGLEEILESLNLANNKISSLTGASLQLHQLKVLDLSGNNLERVHKMSATLPSLLFLNISNNENLEVVPTFLIQGSPMLTSFDASRSGVKSLQPDLFSKSDYLKVLKLAGNQIHEITDTSLRNLKNLTFLDLSDNLIASIKAGSFASSQNLKVLLLDQNQLTSLKGEYFKGRGDRNFTSLEVLSLANNDLSYLFPSSFKIHPKLKYLSAHHNKFTFFPAELISNLQYLEKIDLSHNKLKTVEEMDFSRLPRLRELLLQGNDIEAVSESAFHNSTQLQIINLSSNKIGRIAERTFEGLVRLEHLYLEENELEDFPDNLFDRTKVQKLENINLAHNKFATAPLKPLHSQYFFLSSVNLSHNVIQEISAEDVTMVNIKKLDVSFNPLSQQSVQHILEEPKTVRELSLAGVNVQNITHLEMPFLKMLDISHNNISQLSASVFQRSTMLESLNLSQNQITSFSDINVWKSLENLRKLEVSGNPIEKIQTGELDDLQQLKVLNLFNLGFISKIEKNAFKQLGQLKELRAFGYPRLGYLDVKGILQYLPNLQYLDIELKDNTVGSEELKEVMHSRLQHLGLYGKQINTISTGVFAGLKAPTISLQLINTSVSNLPQGLFFPLPRSSAITLDISGSQISTLSPQFLTMFEDHRKHLDLLGLDSNPIVCDCTAKALKRWLNHRKGKVVICQDDLFQGENLNNIPESELSCEVIRHTTQPPTTEKPPPSSTRSYRKPTTEADIIWTLAPKRKVTPKPPKIITSAGAGTVNNDDMLIISIVGGVVAFIIILVIVICIIRLRMVNRVPTYRGGPLAAQMPHPMANPYVFPSKPGAAPSLYMAPSYATLAHKSQGMQGMQGEAMVGPPRPASQLQSYYQSAPAHSQSAYYVPYTPDEKIEYR